MGGGHSGALKRISKDQHDKHGKQNPVEDHPNMRVLFFNPNTPGGCLPRKATFTILFPSQRIVRSGRLDRFES